MKKFLLRLLFLLTFIIFGVFLRCSKIDEPVETMFSEDVTVLGVEKVPNLNQQDEEKERKESQVTLEEDFTQKVASEESQKEEEEDDILTLPTKISHSFTFSEEKDPSLITGIAEKTEKSIPPFTIQAPFSEWGDPRQQDACEEASVLMAVYWAEDKELSKREAKSLILDMSKYQEEKHGEYIDTSLQDTLDWLILGYFSYEHARIIENISLEDMIGQIKDDSVILVSADGRKLKNPNFTPPGPEHHMLLIYDFDHETREFITNDPGTKKGAGYRYDEKVLYSALIKYETGDHQPNKSLEKSIIVVSKTKKE